MKEITILGSSGYLGNALISKLKTKKFKIKAMIHKNTIKHSVNTFHGDIINLKSLEKNIQSNDIVVNLIGQLNNNHSSLYKEAIDGSINLLETCVKKKIKKIIFISSINVYGNNIKKASKESDIANPETYYGSIKLLTEKIYQIYSMKYNLNVIILRVSNLYGPTKSSGLIGNLIKSYLSDIPCTINHKGNQFRDFIFIDDAVNAIIKSIEKKQKGLSIFNISSGRRYRINDIIDIIQSITHKKLKIKKNSDTSDEKCLWANNMKAKNGLAFTPKISLKKGLDLTFNPINALNEKSI